MNQLLKSFVTIVFIFVLESRKSECAFNCYQCATKALEKNWPMTGLQLPSKFKDTTFFRDDCDNGANPSTDSACTDFCFTMFIEGLSPTGEAKSGSTYVVRGCHSDFTGFTYPSGLNSIGTDYNGACQWGQITRYTSTAVPVNTTAGYQWCNIDAAGNTPCNKYKITDFPTAPTCVKYPTVQCYSCVEGSSVPCTASSTVPGTYCYTSNMKINGNDFITRSVSDINPLYPNANGSNQPQNDQGKCGDATVSYPAGFTNITVSSETCYCNYGNLCNNGAATVMLSFIFLLLSSACFVLMQF